MQKSESTPVRPRVLSGMRPTGKLHLGNYMGALANWVTLQDQYECYFFIADWHALTTDYADPSRIKLNTLDVALDWLAAGLDPQRSTIFIQSHVPQHAELHLLLSMMTPLGWLERVPTYKEQQENLTNKDLSTYGFLGYPLLMASDILLYQAQCVPVGQDQTAHVEFTRETARRFNSLYKVDVFPEPEALFTPSPKLTGTDGRKMSKSYGNTIGLTEAPASVIDKIHHMSTNGQRVRQTDAGDPDLCPVGDLHKVFSSPDLRQACEAGCRKASIRCETCKADAAKSVCTVIEPIYNKRMQLESRVEEAWLMMRESSRRAELRAEQTMKVVRDVFDLSHDISDLRRHFVSSKEELQKARDLSHLVEWRNLPVEQMAKELREYWRANLVSRDVQLSQEANKTFTTIERELEEPFITAKKKRAFVTAASQTPAGWDFSIPPKSFEVWTLLCWNENGWLDELVIPQKFYSQPFAQAKKAMKNESIPVRIQKTGESWTLIFLGAEGQASEPIDVTSLSGNQDPLK